MHGNTAEVHRLQEKLMYSWKSRALAVRIVTSNKGGKTPGSDNVVWSTHTQKYEAINLLKIALLEKEENYQAGLIKRVWIPKPNSSELRPLGIPTMLDRALQTLVVFALDPIVEQISDLHSYGSRKFRGTWDAMTRLRTLLDKKTPPRWVWDADISDCFNQISHDAIMTKLNGKLFPKGTKLVYKWLKASIFENGKTILVKKGIPQGGVISPLLCNMVLNGLEKVVRKGYVTNKAPSKLNLTYTWSVRYVDDFVITCPCRNKLENEIIPSVRKFLEASGLSISEKKSKILDMNVDTLEFLGWELSYKTRKYKLNNQSKSGNKRILIVKPSRKALTNIKSNIRTEFKSYKPFVSIISELNVKIRGWVNYYRISAHSRKSFHSIRNYIYHMWWRWAIKNHPKRLKKWIYNKYIFSHNKSKWQIGISKSSHNIIINPVQVKIITLRSLESGINPYSNKEYYLSNPRISVINKYREKIYKFHNHKCYVCKELLLPDEQVDLHHLIPKSEGGTYSFKNIVPVHKTCHDTITYGRKE